LTRIRRIGRMAHIMLLYALPDHKFARQLAVQLEQRGMVVWPVPEIPPDETSLAAVRLQGLADASHILGILSPYSNADEPLQTECRQALDQGKRTAAILCADTDIPPHLKNCPVVDFQGKFLIAFEELSDLLRKWRAPTRQLTVEHPPPVAKADLLPISFPSERCWREDRLRINYNLPIVLTREELEMRLPAFLVACHFDLRESTKKRLIGRRQNKKYRWFDPRRADHILVVQRRQGRLRVYYQMTRTQVYHWFPAHYRVLDRESAALYRYLVMGSLSGIFDPVNVQVRRAWALSIGSILFFILLVALVLFLILV
jgi:hypothetical protein